MVSSDKIIRKILYYLSPVVIYGAVIGLINFTDIEFYMFRYLKAWASILFVFICLFIAVVIARYSDCKYKYDPIITFVNPFAFFLIMYILFLFDEGYKYDILSTFFKNGIIYITLAILFVSFVFLYRRLRVNNTTQ